MCGVPVEIGFTQYLRGIETYASVDDLITQLHKDIEEISCLIGKGVSALRTSIVILRSRRIWMSCSARA